MRISFSEEAQLDLDHASDWYLAEQAPEAAERLANELSRALSLLEGFPKLGVESTSGTRVLTLRRFPYSLIYRLHKGKLRVIAVAHHSRRPAYWAGRR